MPTTPNMSLVLPVDHGDDSVWGSLLATVFDLLDSHNHVSGAGVPVPSAGLRINADISWSYLGTYYAIKDAKAIDFQPTTAASVSALSSALWVSSVDSELHFLDASARDVKLTNGGAINVSLVGGIGGDYSSVSALLSFDDATDSYWLQQQGSPRPWARARVGDVDIYETAASIVNRVRLSSPAALAASYALTFPAALPGSTSVLQVSSAGAITASNTIANAVTMSSTATVGSTLGVTGLITATAGLTAAVNQHLTVSGTGRLKHGAMELVVPAADFQALTPGSTEALNSNGYWVFAAPPNDTVEAPVRLPVGARILSVTWSANNGGSGSSFTLNLKKRTNAGVTSTVDGGTAGGSGTGFTTFARSSINATLATGEAWWLEFQAGATAHQMASAAISYDYP